MFHLQVIYKDKKHRGEYKSILLVWMPCDAKNITFMKGLGKYWSLEFLWVPLIHKSSKN